MDGVPKLSKDWPDRQMVFYHKDEEVRGGGVATRDHHRISFPGVAISVMPGPLGATLVDLQISRMKYSQARGGASMLFEDFTIRAQGYGGPEKVVKDAVEHAVNLGLLEIES